ncbi:MULTISPECIES: response regulator transcription factor [unclassified Leifsonia]|uniref:response regulator transcription factor n=1 Tax=unclassified Leifsonia TaxID=2663824 RepID=UPI0006FECE6E|nr:MULTISPECIES: response regulator transcription factor [unclassified Leifsonia]KQX07714.1 two-component system response regulator [Leifsonia sp. Root1293]KRA11996.1 two-component system response regulator [Leifsonia sp. Root60]
MRILVVDDEVEMTELLARGLAADGHHVTQAHDGIAAMGAARSGQFDVAVVDLMLPGMSGFELSRRLKEFDPTIAVILLTARQAVDDRVRGLDSGADDYMVKPFDLAELSARIRAVRRRDALHAPARIDVGNLVIDLHRHRVRVEENDIAMSRTEFDVLRVLASKPNETRSRATILEEVWDSSSTIDSNVVDQYVSYLRRKLDLTNAGVRIVTIRGIGFQLITTPSS